MGLSLLAALSGDGVDLERAIEAARAPVIRDLLERLEAGGLLDTAPPPGPDPTLAAAELAFLGHNTVLLRSPEASLLVDPLLFARLPEFPADYQPLQRRELGALDAVLLTHSHADHFDLLRKVVVTSPE